MNETKRFPLRDLLTVTTGRLLTRSRGPDDNGIEDLYKLLEWLTGEPPFTHQLPRFGAECKPWLLRWFPELAACSTERALQALDDWRKGDRTGGDEAIKMWLTELRMMFPTLKDEYDVPHIPMDDHTRKDVVEELVEMVGRDRVVVIEVPESP